MLAIAEAVRESGRPVRTLFAGPAGGVAERMVADAAGDFVPLEVHPLRGAGVARWLRGIVDLPGGALRSLRVLRAHRPEVVVSSGAHTSGPLVALASLRGIPTLLFEANVEVGLANRLLGRVVHRAAVAWPETMGAFRGCDFLTGWPVPRAMRDAERCAPVPGDEFRLLILGGSGGTADLDRAVRDSLTHLGPIARRLSVVHQSSENEVAALRESYQAAGINARVEPFFTQMAEHYRRASLVITRAGAATIAELAALGLPAILVPLPAAGEHQLHNARAWEAAGCSRTLGPHELSGRTLAESVLALAQNRVALDRMSDAARTWHRADAASRLAEWCFQAIRAS